MKNTELMAMRRDHVKGGLDRQRWYVLHLLNVAMPCPNCNTEQTWFQGAHVGIDDVNLVSSTGDERCTCIGCERELVYTVPLFMPAFGSWVWRLVPVKVGGGA